MLGYVWDRLCLVWLVQFRFWLVYVRFGLRLGYVRFWLGLG